MLPLRLGLLEAVERNKELNEELTQKMQQLDEQVKASRSQAKLIKVSGYVPYVDVEIIGQVRGALSHEGFRNMHRTRNKCLTDITYVN